MFMISLSFSYYSSYYACLDIVSIVVPEMLIFFLILVSVKEATDVNPNGSNVLLAMAMVLINSPNKGLNLMVDAFH